MKVFFLLSVLVLFVVLINILMLKVVQYFALKNYIRPFLNVKHIEIVDTKLAGLFNRGDFAKVDLIIKPVSVMGNMVNSAYVFIYTNEVNNARYTAKIDTVLMCIRTVELKRDGVTVILSKNKE